MGESPRPEVEREAVQPGASLGDAEGRATAAMESRGAGGGCDVRAGGAPSKGPGPARNAALTPPPPTARGPASKTLGCPGAHPPSRTGPCPTPGPEPPNYRRFPGALILIKESLFKEADAKEFP